MRWWERVSAWDEEHRLAVDALTAVGLLLFVVPLSYGVLGIYDDRPVAVGAAVIMSVAVVWRRVRPVASAAVVFAAALGHLLLGVPVVLPADALVLLALYSVTVHGPVWAYRTAFGSALVGSGVLGLALLAADELSNVVAAALVTFLAVL
ncbi:MAG: sensor histidine kinase, partial [Actinotalea sp.]|nr:sensor histidine kinase [Actinotalea sp.]